MRDSLEYLEVLELNASINNSEGERRSSSNLPMEKIKNQKSKIMMMMMIISE